MFHNSLRLPWRGMLARLLERLANSQRLARVRRALISRLPFMTLESDVVHVLYANWVVPVAAVQDVLPPGMLLQTVGEHTILTVLSYRHGHFGPRFLGPLRRLLPSPLQSNWRLYVARMADGSVAQKTVLFIKNIFSSAIYGIGTRLFSDVLPSHIAAQFALQRTASTCSLRIDGGSGSAPSFAIQVEHSAEQILPTAFQPFFADWAAAIRSLTEQDCAVAEVAGLSQLAYGGIALPIDLASVQALHVSTYEVGQFLREHGVSDTPFCFMLPQVRFLAMWEQCK